MTRSVPRVLLIVENIALARDHRLQKQVGSLSANGYAVSVISRADPGNHAFPGVRVYEYNAPADATTKLGFVREYGYSLAMAAWLTLKAFVAEPFDVIQVSGTPDIYFTIGAPFKLLGKRLVLDQRDLSPELFAIRYGRGEGPVYRVLRWLERISCRVADHVVTVNGSLETILSTRGRVPAGKVTVVGNGPLLTRATKRPPRIELKQGRRFLCCWLGFMGPQDRVDVAVRAIDHLVHVIGRTDCHFAFIGDGDARQASEKLAAGLGLQDWVTFAGWANQDQAFVYLSTADLGLEPNLEDFVSPVKAMEYMAFGLPFVAFDVKETRMLAAEAAAYAQPGDVAGFAHLIDRLLDDPARRAELARIGRQRFEDSIAWERQEPAYLDVYQRLLRLSPSRALERV
jgi:glycosyltransferase involved in cell wall biosynthesis